MIRFSRSLTILGCLGLALSLGAPAPAVAQEQPRSGGELVFVVAAEPPSFDGHREETFAMLHPSGAPLQHPDARGSHRPDRHQVHRRPRRVVDGLAGQAHLHVQDPPRREVPRRQPDDLRRREGLLRPDHLPAGRGSCRAGKAAYRGVESVEAPNARHGGVPAEAPEASFIANLSSPWNYIYKAEILAKDPHWYEKNIMGTGPFKFVEYVRGSHWVGKKNPDYWDKGKPYLDGYRAIFIQDAGAQVAAIRGERAMIQFRGFTPASATAWSRRSATRSPCRRAPGTARSRWRSTRRRSRSTTSACAGRSRWRSTATRAPRRSRASRWSRRWPASRCRARRGRRRPAELEKLAGYGRDINAARAEARRLLKEAGAEDLSFTLTEPRGPAALRAVRHLADRPVAADRRHRQAGDPARPPPGSRRRRRRLRGVHHRAVQLHRRARHGHPLVPHDLTGELRQAQGHGDGRSLLAAVARHRSRGAPEDPAAVREAALRRGGPLHHGVPVAPHRARTSPRCAAGRSRRATS